MGVRAIKGANGLIVHVSGQVASGLVSAGHAVYADSGGEVEEAAVAETEAAVPTPEEPEDEVPRASGGFDPSTARVSEVLEYLRGADEAETARVLAVEAAGKGRASILGN